MPATFMSVVADADTVDDNAPQSSSLNDTGIDWGWNGFVLTDFETCAGYSITSQDCSHGRD